jgi:hypothetical protein
MGVMVTIGVPLNTSAPPPGATSAEITAAQIASTNTTTVSAAGKTSTSSSPFILASTYISNVGDEPPAGTSVLDLSLVFSGLTMANLGNFLTYLPRSMFTPWFNQSVLPNIVAPAPVLGKFGIVNTTATVTLQDAQNMVRASFLSFFNQTNMQYANAQKIDPWAWETLKTEAYYQQAASPQESTVFQNAVNNVDLQAISLAQQYQSLPLLGDPGLELRRQNAVLWLLNNKYYSDAQDVINQFKNLSNVQNAIISVPIPVPISIPASASSSGAAETLNPTNAVAAS